MVCSALALYFIGISQSWLAVLLLIVQMLILSDPEAARAGPKLSSTWVFLKDGPSEEENVSKDNQ